MKKNTLKRFMASAMTAVMCVSSLGTLAVNAAPADPAAETSVVDNLMSKMTLRICYTYYISISLFSITSRMN